MADELGAVFHYKIFAKLHLVRDELEPSICMQASGQTHRRTVTHHDETNSRFSQLRPCAEKLSSFLPVRRILHYEDQEDDDAVQKNGPYLM